ncbi:MAG: HPP family protein [Rhodobacter sp.]|nr:HPP family protein [Rhodobacter sp.]MBK8440604.1 HPP family protein [Rhodobacter sp.]
MNRVFRALGPAMPWPKPQEALRAGLGAALGLVVAGVVLHRLSGGAVPMLIAPFGATAFLIFAVPNSPLAQPWSVVVGSVASALVAVLAVHAVPAQLPAAALAVGGAVLAMAGLRAMHPPAGAVALLVVLTADPAALPGPGFALFPVAEGAALLVLCGVLWNRLTGRVYPFRQPAAQGPHGTSDAAPERRLGLLPDDLQAILDRLRLSANLGAEDLGRALEAAEAEATARHLGALSAADVMSRDVVTVAPDTPEPEIAAAFMHYRFNTLPVQREDGSLAGLILDRNLIAADSALTAVDLAAPVVTLPPEAGLAELLALISDGRQQSVPIVEGGKLVGIITRSDLIALMARKVRMEEPA